MIYLTDALISNTNSIKTNKHLLEVLLKSLVEMSTTFQKSVWGVGEAQIYQLKTSLGSVNYSILSVSCTRQVPD